ncbi:MAG: hypothetical protein Q9168_005426 [Polycauliona sp. 1 TL-2023]
MHSGFVPLSRVSSDLDREVNVIGVVTDFQNATKSRGSDFTCNFELADEKDSGERIRIRYFRSLEEDLPQVKANGDVVILQRVKVGQWSNMIVGISTRNTLWTVFPATSIPENVPIGRINLQCIKGKGASAPTEEQMRSAIELCNSIARTVSNTAPTIADLSSTNQTQSSGTSASTARVSSSTTGRRDKFSLVKNVSAGMYCDLVGQVVKTYSGSGAYELYITDYTSNTLLFNYAWGHDDDQDSVRPKWPGPLGKQTLTVSLFPPHSYYAMDNVREGQYVFLRNTRIKNSRDSKLEGCLHTDRMNENRVDITIIKEKNDERVKDLLRRKMEYGKQFSQQTGAFVSLSEGQKRKQTEEPKLSKNQAKKQRKEKRKEEAKRKQQQFAASDSEEEKDKENDDPCQVRITPNVRSGHHQRNQHSTPATSPPPEKPPIKSTTLNENIRASNHETPTRSLTSILSYENLTTPEGLTTTLPFRNVKSRAAVRVVDFYPRNLADFAIRKKPASEYDVLSDYEGDSDSSSGEDVEKLPPDTDEEDNINKDSRNTQSDRANDSDEEDSQWEWRFILILEDASAPSKAKEPNERMTLYVGGADAEFLLKIDACDLRRKKLRLAALGEKLFLLWGDLEEKMNAAIERNPGQAAARVRILRNLKMARKVSDRELSRK